MSQSHQLASIMPASPKYYEGGFTDIVGYTANTIGKVLLSILALILFSQCEKDDPIPVVTIPDNNFLSSLINQGVDKNLDGIISVEEAMPIISLDVSNRNISDMTGIEAFIKLEHLNCSSNQLATLDVSHNTALTELLCAGNKLTRLDVSNNTALTELSLKSNQLTSLDVSNNTALTFLSLSGNQLTNLDISNNTALTVLSLEVNQLTSLDVSNNTALTFLSLSNNQLTNLDVSNNTALEWLFLSHNQLTSLDVSNNTALTSIDLHDMPSINEVCVWEMPFPPDGVGVDMTNSPNVFFTTDCT